MSIDQNLYSISKGGCTWEEKLVFNIATVDGLQYGVGFYNPETNTWQTLYSENINGIANGTLVNSG
ncbi:hypothetical protein [Eubacterium aggregans]|uniref:hypothetical protein n=1 Tax=Eubacterium aggregans TaxID=81409 RepID=UPI003F37ECD3